MSREASHVRTPCVAAPQAGSARRLRWPAGADVLAWALLPALLVLVLWRGSQREAVGSPPFLVLAFWAALADFEQRGGGRGNDGVRLALGLGLGAILAHLGWCVLHPSSVAASPRLLFAFRGFSGLFLPLGVLALAPWRGDRMRYLAPAVGCLALGLAVARLGCISAGCCRGAPTRALWAIGGRHPTRWLEWAGLASLCLVTRQLRPGLVAPLTLAGYGALRLALAPMRAADAAGPVLFAPSWVSAAWLLAGAGWALRQGIRRLAPPPRTPSP